MTEWALLAPGPSASEALADRLRDSWALVGVVGNAYQLAPWADFVAATDRAWWGKYAEAKALAGRKFSMHPVGGVEQVKVLDYVACNSGVLALECAKNLGATRIRLFGFDMRGGHFFGNYTNGLKNTTPARRRLHLLEYQTWTKANLEVQVVNCTPGSALECFPFEENTLAA